MDTQDVRGKDRQIVGAYRRVIERLVFGVNGKLCTASEAGPCCTRHSLYRVRCMRDFIPATIDDDGDVDLDWDNTFEHEASMRGIEGNGDEFIQKIIQVIDGNEAGPSRLFECSNCYRMYVREEANRLPQGSEEDEEEEYEY